MNNPLMHLTRTLSLEKTLRVSFDCADISEPHRKKNKQRFFHGTFAGQSIVIKQSWVRLVSSNIFQKTAIQDVVQPPFKNDSIYGIYNAFAKAALKKPRACAVSATSPLDHQLPQALRTKRAMTTRKQSRAKRHTHFPRQQPQRDMQILRTSLKHIETEDSWP